MKADIIRTKLAKYYRKDSDTIILEVLEGKPYSKEGGLWIEVDVKDLERITEAADFDPIATGYEKYLRKWVDEKLITPLESKLSPKK